MKVFLKTAKFLSTINLLFYTQVKLDRLCFKCTGLKTNTSKLNTNDTCSKWMTTALSALTGLLHKEITFKIIRTNSA